MKKSSLFLAAALAVFVGISWWLRSAAPPQSTAEAPVPASVPTTAPVAVKAKVRIPKPAGKFLQDDGSNQEEGNVIAFQVKDGLAIAYGDQIIGEPEDPSITEGFYQAPAPTLWERPEIPYSIHDDVPNPERIKEAMALFTAHTPVTFIPYDGQQPDAVVFEVGKENCYSLLGKQGGLQPVKLAADCGPLEIAHELMHVLGFVHEQSRPDRDRFVEVNWRNIKEGFEGQFKIVPENFMEAARQGAFDFHSIMLYSPDIFAKEGTKTMASRGAEGISPSTTGLSPGDIEKLRDLYRPYVK